MIRRSGLYDNSLGSESSTLVINGCLIVEGEKRKSVMSSIQLGATETSRFVD